MNDLEHETFTVQRWSPSSVFASDRGGFVAYGDYLELARRLREAYARIKWQDDAHRELAERTACLEKDASRYRWLVDNSFDREPPQMHCWWHTWEPHSVSGELTEWKQRVRGPAIDRVIDAAMGEPK